MPKPYRIAFFTKSKRRTRYTLFIIRALRRIGCRVQHVNMGALRRTFGRTVADRIARLRVDRFAPDAVVVFSSDILPETLDHFASRYRTAVLLDDYFPVEAPVTDLARKVDVFFHTMTGQLDEYRAAGVRKPVYLHSGVDPDFHRPGPRRVRFESDLAFIGKAIYPDRIELIRALDTDFDLKVYGAGWKAFGITPARSEIATRDFSQVCSSAKIIVGIDKAADRELYFSNRTWFVLGCGGFLLTRYVPGLETIFANHRHLVWYSGPDEARDLARHYLDHDEQRVRIARTGHEFAHAEYPFDRMAANLVRVLLEEGEADPLTDPGPSVSVDACLPTKP